MTKRWRDELYSSARFDSFSTSSVEFNDVLTTDQFVSLVSSFAWLGVLPVTERAAALATVRDLVAPMGELTLPYRTDFEYAQASH
jgi:hypothetical protein